ncbi:MAG: phosphoglucosamine mutase [Pseudomonadota bacterium]
MGRVFGTDGIRARVGDPPLTREGVAGFARAIAGWIGQGAAAPMIVVAGDTRASTAGFIDQLCATWQRCGINTANLGVCPTPALADAARRSDAAAGVMVTASHNPATYNGFKVFGADGYKLSASDEAEIEALMAGTPEEAPATGAPGRSVELPALDPYLKGLVFQASVQFAGMKLVVDLAHGAACGIAKTVFDFSGAKVTYIGDAPDGQNINAGVGAAHPEAMAKTVVEAGADAGIALDGDADRVIMADERGRIIDGDQLIAFLARQWSRAGMLEGGAVAATVMSNLGLERALASLGLELVRTRVGDRHVVEAMRSRGLNLGGEQSGHLVLADQATTGDGLAAALTILQECRRLDGPISQALHVFDPVPQRLVNVPVEAGDLLADPGVVSAMDQARSALGEQGRLLVRPSGTEPLVRIMVECADSALIERVLREVEAAVRAAR